MTVQNTGNRISYTGDGSSTAFSFPYKIIATSDMKAFVGGLSTTSFTVSTPSDSGVTVTFLVAPAAGLPIVLLRDPDLLQQSSLPSTGPFPAGTVERMIDKVTLQMQRMRELINRSLTLADADTSTASTTLPTPESNKVIGWNSAATQLVNLNATDLVTTVTYGSTSKDVFTGDGAAGQALLLTNNPGSVNNVRMTAGGVAQEPGVDFTWDGNKTLTLVAAVPNGVRIVCVYSQGLPVGTVADASVTTSKLADGSVTPTKLDRAYLPLAGGTMTGPLTLAGNAVNPLEAMPLQQATGRLLAVRVFTVANNGQTYTPTAGTSSVIVAAVGGGGAAGGSFATGAGQVAVCGAGGSGTFGMGRYTTGFAGVTLTIGAAGAGVAAAPGGAGGVTSFGALLSCPGGVGGLAGGAAASSGTYANTAPAPSADATGANIVSFRGSMGTPTIWTSAGSNIPGEGGSSPIGRGGFSAAGPSGYGGGGAGYIVGQNTAAIAGGAGTAGAIIVYEYA